MSLSQFSGEQNINMLWEVLLGELNLNKSNKQIVDGVRTVFEGNISLFKSRANPRTSLMQLNKLFLSQVVLAVNKLFPPTNRIIITDEEVSEPYKVEDIHASRQTEFEHELEKKRLELESYMGGKKPQSLDFSEKYENDKLTSLDIEEKIQRRNAENDTLLLPPLPLTTNVDDRNFNNQKYSDERKVSFHDQDESFTASNTIFSKLKKQPESLHSQYEEQHSISLPEVRQEEIVRTVTPAIISTTDHSGAVLPKTELVKQLNEMNKKINDIYELLQKLVNSSNNNN
jgi:hypothetical protein